MKKHEHVVKGGSGKNAALLVLFPWLKHWGSGERNHDIEGTYTVVEPDGYTDTVAYRWNISARSVGEARKIAASIVETSRNTGVYPKATTVTPDELLDWVNKAVQAYVRNQHKERCLAHRQKKRDAAGLVERSEKRNAWLAAFRGGTERDDFSKK